MYFPYHEKIVMPSTVKTVNNLQLTVFNLVLFSTKNLELDSCLALFLSGVYLL